jgi:formylglycine-generating enzyme required for sulfatase activity
MKRVLILILLLFLVFTLPAQQIAVRSFRSLSNDLDARASFPKIDKNGEKAALIKIVTTEIGFEFDGGMIGIVAVIPKTSEIWLYIPRGSKVVTIKHPKLGLLRNYPYPQSIEAGEVYEMVLTTGKVISTVEEQAIESQWLIINTEPSGADVYINDKPAGKTTYQSELPVGKYNWRVSKELYLTEAGIAELLPGAGRQEVNVKMKPNFGRINITTAPENGASVSLNDIAIGKVTPCTIEMVKSGDHILSLSRDEYETTTQRFTLTAGETKQVAVNMNPTFAEVTVKSEPVADIYINSQYKAKATWQGRLTPGIYTFEAKLEKYSTATEKKTVIVGQPLAIILNPVPKTGNLKIVTTPYNATIKINGKNLGQTPFTLKNQLIGDYAVEISLPGYATVLEKATITEGQTSEINTSLQSGMQVEIISNPSGANLFIDNKFSGKTPYSCTLSFGSHTFRVESNDKKNEKAVLINQGGPSTFALNITPNYTETASDLNIEMIFVEGGTFRMGSNDGKSDEKPVHTVTLSDFYVGKTEVTQKQWRNIMGNNPSYFNCDNCPVELVSWNDIQGFIQTLNKKTNRNYRLPTEAEWEYAARGGNKSKGYKYSGSHSLGEVAWYSDNSNSKTHPVAQLQPNELGVYDMTGSVWEWCNDHYGSYSEYAQPNPKGPSSGEYRVVRGGSWDVIPHRCRTTGRDIHDSSRRDYYLGFRLVSNK